MTTITIKILKYQITVKYLNLKNDFGKGWSYSKLVRFSTRFGINKCILIFKKCMNASIWTVY